MRAGFVLKDIETGETFSYNPADVPALLRVARAADYIFTGPRDKGIVCGTCNTRLDVLDLLKEALKEVEHLLE